MTRSVPSCRSLVALGCALALAFAPSCLAAEPETYPTSQALWDIIANPRNPYTQWQFLPEVDPATGKVITFPLSVGEQPHGDWVAVYVNEPAFDSIQSYDPASRDTFQMNPGSILVKENYPGGAPPDLSKPIDQRDGLLSLTVMWKVPGFDVGVPLQVVNPAPPNPATSAYLIGGEWFWSMYTNDGSGQVVTLATQGFFTKPPSNVGKFNIFIGETQTLKSWFCQSCHQGATGVGAAKYKSYGDWVWRLVPFEEPPPPPR